MTSLRASLASVLIALLSLGTARAAAPLKALILDGQNNHDWKSSTPHLKQVIEATGLFAVDVATAPGKGGDMGTFRPKFADYQVVVSNYNGERWTKETEEALVDFVRKGGGFVPVHAANNAFPDWKGFNEMIGVGGWGGRDEKSGPWLHWEGKLIRDLSPGPGGSHGKQHPFLMETRAPEHPVMKGLPTRWMHAKDELYDRLRGPAENVTVLATAYSDPATHGTGKNEALLFAIQFGRGRVFHTALGHNNGPDLTSQKCAGFIITLQRGVEWAATGKVTQKIPADFPGEDAVRSRP
jgi:type 1 glutamine amidotransferase